jgi:CRP/FNR family transcriptional regulator, cyclic AMP receptor protein
VGILRQGNFFGELALLDGGPRSASAIALDAVETLTLDRGPFVAILERQPQMAGALLGVLGDRLRRTDELVQDILFLDLPGRLAKHLLALAGDHGAPVADGTRIELRLNQSDLAAIVGATRESVNRCLNAYAERGLLRVERDAITILQPQVLQDRIY